MSFSYNLCKRIDKPFSTCIIWNKNPQIDIASMFHTTLYSSLYLSSHHFILMHLQIIISRFYFLQRKHRFNILNETILILLQHAPGWSTKLTANKNDSVIFLFDKMLLFAWIVKKKIYSYFKMFLYASNNSSHIILLQEIS